MRASAVRVTRIVSDYSPSPDVKTRVFPQPASLVSLKKMGWNNMYALSVLAIERRTLMAIGRPISVLTLSDEERDALERWARRPMTAQALAQRARLVLACARGRTNTQVARELRLTKQTVGKWRSRFLVGRLDGLLDEPRPGAPRLITDAAVEHVVTLTLETKPREATHWSTRAMAARCGLSQSTVSRIWRALEQHVRTERS